MGGRSSSFKRSGGMSSSIKKEGLQKDGSYVEEGKSYSRAYLAKGLSTYKQATQTAKKEYEKALGALSKQSEHVKKLKRPTKTSIDNLDALAARVENTRKRYNDVLKDETDYRLKYGFNHKSDY